jgi:hypothetical protein
MMKLGITCSCGLANLGKIIKLGFTYLFLFAGKPIKNDEIRIHLPVVCAGKTRKNNEIRIYLPVPLCW